MGTTGTATVTAPPAAPLADKTFKIYLRWFRDKGRGQEAADALSGEGVIQDMDLTWPIAVWSCKTNKEAMEKWDRLWAEFKVNAMTYVICY